MKSIADERLEGKISVTRLRRECCFEGGELIDIAALGGERDEECERSIWIVPGGELIRRIGA